MAITQDASRRVINFYLDEADAVRLDKYCDMNDITRTQFIEETISRFIAGVELSPEDLELVNINIKRRILKGYPKNHRSEKRYER